MGERKIQQPLTRKRLRSTRGWTGSGRSSSGSSFSESRMKSWRWWSTRLDTFSRRIVYWAKKKKISNFKFASTLRVFTLFGPFSALPELLPTFRLFLSPPFAPSVHSPACLLPPDYDYVPVLLLAEAFQIRSWLDWIGMKLLHQFLE